MKNDRFICSHRYGSLQRVKVKIIPSQASKYKEPTSTRERAAQYIKGYAQHISETQNVNLNIFETSKYTKVDIYLRYGKYSQKFTSSLGLLIQLSDTIKFSAVDKDASIIQIELTTLK